MPLLAVTPPTPSSQDVFVYFTTADVGNPAFQSGFGTALFNYKCLNRIIKQNSDLSQNQYWRIYNTSPSSCCINLMVAVGQSLEKGSPSAALPKAIEIFLLASSYTLHLPNSLVACMHNGIYVTPQLREQAFYPTELSSTLVPNQAYCVSSAAN